MAISRSSITPKGGFVLSSTQQGFAESVLRHTKELTATEQRVVDWISRNMGRTLHLSIAALANASGISEATIVRTCQRLGFAGYPELKLGVAFDLATASEPGLLGQVRVEDDPETLVRKVFNANARSMVNTVEQIDYKSFTAAMQALLTCSRVEVFAGGLQAHMADSTSSRFISTGIPCVGRVDHLQQLSAAAMMDPTVVLIVMSHSGRVRTLVQAAQLAKDHGAVTIGITNVAESPLAKTVDIPIIIYGHDLSFYNESMGSHAVQMILIDCLVLGIAARRQDKVLANMLAAREATACMRL